jgi:paired small multidrug resistance pump
MYDLQWYDGVGLVGTMMVLFAYYLLQADRVRGNGLAYQLLNLFGAGGVLVSLYGGFNAAVFVLMAVWILITIYGLTRKARSPGSGSPPLP